MLKYLPLKGGRKESGTDRKRRQVVYVIVIAKQNYAEKKKKERVNVKSQSKRNKVYIFLEKGAERNYFKSLLK